MIAALVLLAALAEWRDPSPHKVQMVAVEDGVDLEVLDWGGRGRALVLLAGSGNTAHVFDEFAPKLTGFAHVYAITRRGYGASSRPPTGYDDQRLADDVLAVLRTLRIESPVLAGHSMAGGELTTLGVQHSERLSGLVYLDALGDPRDWPGSDPAYIELFRRLPAEMRGPAGGPNETPLTLEAYRARQVKNEGFAFPESELRNIRTINEDGTMGAFRAPRWVHQASGDGQKKRDYRGIRVPVLALMEMPGGKSKYEPKNDEERAATEAFNRATAAYVERWIANLKIGVPDARVVDLPGAGHYVFLTREPAVLNEIKGFVVSLR